MDAPPRSKVPLITVPRISIYLMHRSAERVPVYAPLHRPVSDGLSRVRRIRLPSRARHRLQGHRQEDLQLDVLLRRRLGTRLARLCRLQQRTGS